MVEKLVYYVMEKVSESFLEILVLENESIYIDLVLRRFLFKYLLFRSFFKFFIYLVVIVWSIELIMFYRGDVRCVISMKKIWL